MRTSPRSAGTGSSAPAPGAAAARRAALLGLAVVLLYLAGSGVSGSLSPLARRPLLDGLAPPTRYRWVKPPPVLAQGNKQPTPMRFTLDLGPKGSTVGAFSTQDGQFNLVFGEGAFPPSPGQSKVAFEVVPLDPATVPPASGGLLAAGNAYRFTAAYQPSRRAVGKLAAETNAGVVYPLLTVPVASAAGHVLLYSPDGRSAWTRLQSIDAPGVHQVSARIPGTGYYLAAIPPASAAPAPATLADKVRGALPAVAVVVLVAGAGALYFRRRR